ncbi:MAG: hypothetical protein WBF37_00680 [Dehalococcoidia bacterium]
MPDASPPLASTAILRGLFGAIAPVTSQDKPLSRRFAPLQRLKTVPDLARGAPLNSEAMASAFYRPIRHGRFEAKPV